MIRTQIMLTATLKTRITNYSNNLNISFSAAVRQLLEQALDKTKSKKNMINDLLELKKHAGKGSKDLASNDNYLYKMKKND